MGYKMHQVAAVTDGQFAASEIAGATGGAASQRMSEVLLLL